MKLIDAIINNSKESRKEYLLHIFEAEGKKSSSNFRYKLWEHENHPVLLDSTAMYNQRLNYLYWNPVTENFVEEPWHGIYNSLIDYLTEKRGCWIRYFGSLVSSKISNKANTGRCR